MAILFRLGDRQWEENDFTCHTCASASDKIMVRTVVAVALTSENIPH